MATLLTGTTIGGNVALHAGNYTSYPDATKLPLAGGTLTGQLNIEYTNARQIIKDGTNTLVMGHWDMANVRIEATGRPLYMVSYGGTISIGRSSGSNLVVDTASVSYGGNAVLTSASTLTAGNLSGTIPSGVLGNSAHFIGTTSIALNRASAAQSLTGVNIDGSSGSCSGNAATATYARRVDGATRTSFTVGGNKDNYYPVIFNIGSGTTELQYSEFVIERGGYEEPGYTFAGGNTFSTLNIRFSCKSNGWGYGASYENVEMHGYTTQLVANWEQMTEASKLIVWLRGATIYHFWNVVANTTLHDGNSGGTSLTLAYAPYYSYTYSSTTTVQAKAQYGKYVNSSTGIPGLYVAGRVLAEGFFSGPGTGLTGTAANLTVGTANSVAAGGIKSGAIEDNAVIFSKIQQVTGPVAIGRTTASLGNVTTLSGADLATIIGANTITNATNATTAGSVTNGVYTTGNQSIAGNKTFTGITSFTNASDYQISLNGDATTWAGIEWKDSNGTDYVWFNGQHKTFAIGGGGSNISGKKLHVDGAVTIGADLDSTAVISNSLNLQGPLQMGNYKTYIFSDLSAASTQARTYEIARIGIDYNDWNSVGTFEVELHEKYYGRGLKKVYNIWYGYVSSSGIRLVEFRGDGLANNFQCRISGEITVAGDQRYISVFIDVRNYGIVDVVVKTNRNYTATANPEMGYTYINLAPTPTNISDFTADSDLEISTLGTAKLGGNTILTSASTSASSLSIGGNAANVTGTVAVANGGTGATTAANARANLEATTLGSNFFTLANPGAERYVRVNAANTVSLLSAADFKTALGIGTSSSGTVTSVSGTGTVSGITLSGTVTAAGNLTLGGSLSGTASSLTAGAVTDGVYASTNQTISGVKTFSSAPVATNIAKAWVHYNMNNNTINASYNVSSVTDNGTGVCTVNFSTAMVDANYVVAGTATYGYDDQDIYGMILTVPRRSTAQQAGSCRLATEFIHGAQVYDCVAVRAVFYR